MAFFDKVVSIGNTILYGEDAKVDNSSTLGVKYDDELENLISMVLSSGNPTDKQREVLCKKAEAKGIDRDEFEMVLDYRILHITNASPSAKGKYGSVKKCPHCGAVVKPFTIKCDECGYEFSNVPQNSSLQELVNQLNAAENHKGGLVGFLTYDSDSAKEEIIRNFPIPTSKEDIFEFLTYAIPLAKKQGNLFNEDKYYDHNNLVPIWKNKCSQIWEKSKIVFADSPEDLKKIREMVSSIGIK